MISVYQAAVLMGFIMVLCGAPLLFSRKEAAKAYFQLMKHRPSTHLLGGVLSLVGLAVLSSQMRIALTFEGIVALFGWAALVKGIYLTWWPEHAFKLMKRWYKTEGMLTFAGLVHCGFGIWFLWNGLGW